MEDNANNQREVMGQRLVHENDAILLFERTGWRSRRLAVRNGLD